MITASHHVPNRDVSYASTCSPTEKQIVSLLSVLVDPETFASSEGAGTDAAVSDDEEEEEEEEEEEPATGIMID
jgi:hypothetical protein